MEKTTDKKSKVIYISFNENNSYFSLGLEDGFEIYKVNPLKRVLKEEMEGGLGIVEMLGKTNILALVGGGKSPLFDPHKVIIWDHQISKKIQEYRFDCSVLGVKMKRT